MTVMVALVLDSLYLDVRWCECGDWSVMLAVYYRRCSDACLIFEMIRPSTGPSPVCLFGHMGHGDRLGLCEVVV